MNIKRIVGALAGWRWEPSEHGVILRIQVAETGEAFHERRFDTVDVALNERQLRSLARDLARAAEHRGIALHAESRKRLFGWF